MKKIIITILLLSGLNLIQAQVAEPRFAYVALDTGVNVLYVWDGTENRAIADDVPPFHAPIWSGDGRLAYLVGTNANELYVWDGTESIQLSITAVPDYGEPVWSNDGRLAYVSIINGMRQVSIWSDGESIEVFPDADGSFRPDWSVDGRLAFEARNGNNFDIYVYDDGEVSNISNREEHDGQPAWALDGSVLFISNGDDFGSDESQRDIYRWDGETLSNITNSPLDNFYIFPDLNGDLIGFTGDDYPLFIWNGEEVISVENTIQTGEWSQGNRLAFLNRDYELWIWGENGEHTFVSEMDFGMPIMSWNTDGQLAFVKDRISSSDFGDLRIKQVYIRDDGTETLIGDGGSPAWLSDGRLAFVRLQLDSMMQSLSDILILDGEEEMLIIEDVQIQSRLYPEK